MITSPTRARSRQAEEDGTDLLKLRVCYSSNLRLSYHDNKNALVLFAGLGVRSRAAKHKCFVANKAQPPSPPPDQRRLGQIEPTTSCNR